MEVKTENSTQKTEETESVLLECEHCDFSSTFKSSYYRHLKNQHGEEKKVKKKVCPVPDCLKEFRDSYGLKRHEKTHQKEQEKEKQKENDMEMVDDSIPEPKLYACPLCITLFQSKKSRRRHVQSKHQGIALLCPRKCGHIFRDKNTLKRHLSRKNGCKPISMVSLRKRKSEKTMGTNSEEMEDENSSIHKKIEYKANNTIISENLYFS